MEETIRSLVQTYGLEAHEEGGYFKIKYLSDQTVFSKEARKERKAISHIYYLLPKGQKSRFHRILHDEIWHVYQGSPMKLIRFDGREVKEEVFGPGCKEYFAVVKGGQYQAAESTGDYTFVGCTVGPGFDYDDWMFLADDEENKDLLTERFSECKRFL